MLRLSKLADYGTVIMAHMAHQPERSYSAAELATAVATALPTVSKLLKILTRHGLLVSQRGARGGYALARPPAEISMADIIDALEGPIGLTECSVATGLCMHESGCAIRASWQRLDRAIYEVLSRTSLTEFAQPAFAPVQLRPARAKAAKPETRSEHDGTDSAAAR